MPQSVTPSFEDHTPLFRKLAHSVVNGRALSKLALTSKLTHGPEVPEPQHELTMNYRRTPPDAEFVRGTSAHVAAKIAAPSMMESQTIQPFGHNTPIWEGWRPRRPEEPQFAEIQMMIPQRGRRIETRIPTEEETREAAETMATEPYPTVPEGSEFAQEQTWRGYGMGSMGSYLGVGDLGIDPAASALLAARTATTPEKPASPDLLSAITGIAGSVASTIKAAYDAKAANYATRTVAAGGNPLGIPYSTGGLPQTPTPSTGSPEIPWGTIALVGGLGLAAFFIIPKVMGAAIPKRRR